MLTALCEALILYVTAKHLSVDRVSLVTITQEMDSVKATSSTVWQSDGSKDTFKSVGNKRLVAGTVKSRTHQESDERLQPYSNWISFTHY